jgi:MoxR-like ATPase
LLDYLQGLVEKTRSDPHLSDGLSPRGALAVLAAARSAAYLAGREYVIPEDVQHVFAAVAGHRLVPRGSDAGAPHDHFAGARIAQRIVHETAVINV